ncbi:hypothetical protein [Actinomadura rudentiformis]|uniref:DUF2269 family protein n=1 Tax=Actinomadura rudentiformis TaxID=359158 RepID=A0A6H9YTX5_9ACTN|nr:hypothetical protein [Actinomadura rudentiformis]KAB2343997.1 hypothetical protein F8566_32160 [Actinomadura rudentiformis]
MSKSDRLLLILHIGFAIFTLGPLTAATMATPRFIRKQNTVVLRYLNRTTRIYGLGALGILLFGLFLADGDFARVWLTASLTLFIVALVLLVLIERDQRRAIHLLEVAAAEAAPATATDKSETKAQDEDGDREEDGAETKAAESATPAAPARSDIAQVERGRIVSLSGVVALLWLVILFLMVWYD